MKHFGIFFSLITCFVLHIVAYTVDKRVFYNQETPAFNIIGIVLISAILYLLIIPKYYKNKITLALFFFLSLIVLLNCTLSLLVDFFAWLRDYQFETNDMSFVVIIPLIFIVALLFGLFFDIFLKKVSVKDAMKTGRTSE